jgi:DNA polymerase-3 subunit chi
MERRRLEDILPGLIEKTLERGWRAIIRTESAERASAVDALLWTYNDASFLPHAITGEGDPGLQPVLITVEEDNANGANVLFLVGGARSSEWGAAAGAYARIVILFDGRDPEALAAARQDWKAARAAGHEVTYWKERASGKWEQQQ